MGFRNPGSAGFPDRSSRPRPVAFPSFLTLFICAGCVPPHFSVISGGNEASSSGGGGEDASSVKALLATSKDNLQTPSSPDSSSTTEPNSALGADRSNTLTENVDMYYRTSYLDNLQHPSSRYSSSSMGVASTSANDPAVRGLLGFINTIAEKMILFYFGLVTFSLAYPLGQKAERTFNDPWVRFICTGSVISSFGSLIIAAFAAHFRESESIDHIRFEIFIWLVFLELVAFISEFCIALHVFGLVSYWVVLPFGIAGFCFIALTWVVYLERPKVLNEWTKDKWRKMESYLWNLNEPRPPI